MKKWLPILVIVGVLVVWGIIKNNTLADLEKQVTTQWTHVENTYQQRADLVPDIVINAEGYVEFDRETLDEAASAALKAKALTMDPSNPGYAGLEQFQDAQGGLSDALVELLDVFERYPELKESERFKGLIEELDSTQSAIDEKRMRYNEVIDPYNEAIGKFPASLIANIVGMKERDSLNVESLK